MPVTLEELLASREARRELQLDLIRKNPDKTLVVLTVNIPGSEKRTPESLVIGEEGVRVLKKTFGVTESVIRDLNTGFEAFLLVPSDGQEAKDLTVSIENDHPLGRLMDIDVFDKDGIPFSRSDRGEPARRCLICGADARVCMRTFAHTGEELQNKIKSIVRSFTL